MWFLYSNHFDLLTHQPTLRALFKLLDWSIDKVYKVISYSKYFKKTSNKVIQSYEHFTDNSLSSRQVQQVDKVCGLFFDQIENILSVVKSYIGFNTALYIKLCRIFRKLLVNPDLFGVLAEE
jgi:UDP-2,3-diacylglucosamine pyrophosphatase LpxH